MDDLQKIWMSDPVSSIFKKLDLFVLKENLLPPRGATIVLACSGGPDSVFLAIYVAYLARRESYLVVLAYFNHEWRAESKQEVEFCRLLAEKYQFFFETAPLSEFERNSANRKKYNGSQEDLARYFRYQFLYAIANQYQASAIMLGHHSDDQVETFLIRVIRGSSLTGLCVMRPRDELLVRPLLCVCKEEIVTFLDANSISYCIDASNENEQYLRNKIRKKLIPTFLATDDRSMKNIEKLIYRLQNAEKCLVQITKEIFEKITIKKENTLHLFIPELMQISKELQYRILLHFFVLHKISITFSESLFEEILRFLYNHKSNTHAITFDFVLKKTSNTLFVDDQKL